MPLFARCRVCGSNARQSMCGYFCKTCFEYREPEEVEILDTAYVRGIKNLAR